MLKIILLALNSGYSHTNLAVRCIKKRLSDVGFDADFLEFSLKDRRGAILSALFDRDADIYGFSTYIWNRRELLSLASDLKKLRPGARIVFGGPEVSFDAEELLETNSFIDCVITGEGEDGFVKLARAVESGENIPKILDGGVFEGFERAGILYSQNELAGERRMLYYESSRGCPYRCAYCLSSLSGGVRAKTAELTLDELLGFESLSADIGVIKFVDRTFNFDRRRAREIWRGLLDGKYTKRYHFEICGELLEDEDFELLAKFPAGKIQLEIGVQSTNPETLSRVGRRTDIERLLGAISRLHSLGNMHIHADLIAGLPGEGFERFGQSFDELFGRCDMLQLGFLKLLRGSRLRAEADSFGCVYSDEPPYEVLSTDCLSFSELRRLHAIDDLLDRYVNSGAFSRSMKLIMSREKSPFGLLDRLAAGFERNGRSIRELSQANAYSELYGRLCGDGTDDEFGNQLALALSLDFLTSQKTSLPRFGSFDFPRREDRELKRGFTEWADARSVGYFAPALEVRGDDYIIDRKRLRAYRRSDGRFAEI